MEDDINLVCRAMEDASKEILLRYGVKQDELYGRIEKELNEVQQASCSVHVVPTAPVFPSPAPKCAAVSRKTAHYVWEKELYLCICMRVFLLLPRIGGPLPQNTHVRPSVHPLTTFYKYHIMWEDKTTNLSLKTPRSVESRFSNLQISLECSRQISYNDSYK
jgi:hypothetical protein